MHASSIGGAGGSVSGVDFITQDCIGGPSCYHKDRATCQSLEDRGCVWGKKTNSADGKVCIGGVSCRGQNSVTCQSLSALGCVWGSTSGSGGYSSGYNTDGNGCIGTTTCHGKDKTVCQS
eukprot:TRINITY_DN82033_c0_g1_i1.p1 TRINITY_DN82033_c0_g1~~TRINITY_DN82033_c0_g1_i1.p1  ORF type:complete len:120 (+),score=7.50 TRINITY_DN82033_c0_g1_i1:154-513(+)